MSAIANQNTPVATAKAIRSNTPALEIVEASAAPKPVTFTYVELSSAEIDKRILDITAKGSKLRKLIQETLVGTMIHFVNHGDFTKLIPLRKAVAESLGQNMANAMSEFVEFTSPLRFINGKFEKAKGTTNSFCHMVKADFDVKKIETYESKGRKWKPFYDMERVVAPPKPIVWADRVAALVNEGLRLQAEKTTGKDIKKGEKTVTVKVKHVIDDKDLNDFVEWAAKHGVAIVEGKAVAQTNAGSNTKQ